MNESLYLGVEIGGTKVQAVLGNHLSDIIDRRRYRVDLKAGGAGIRAQIAQALADYSARHRIAAVGIGFGGPVDWRTGRTCCSHHVEGWSNFDLGSWMKDLARVPVAVENDANTAALGEALKGAGKGSNPVFYVTLGSGVGGGLVVDGDVYHGAPPGEAEIGHVRLDRSGTIVEDRCSGWAVDRRIREAVAKGEKTVLGEMISGEHGGEARFLRKAIERGDALARKILEETAQDLAFGLSHVVHLFHPEVIVLGGGLSLLGELLREAVERNLKTFLMDAFAPGPRIAIAGLGEDAVPVGALLLARGAVKS